MGAMVGLFGKTGQFTFRVPPFSRLAGVQRSTTPRTKEQEGIDASAAEVDSSAPPLRAGIAIHQFGSAIRDASGQDEDCSPG